jgi:ABC-2 type transport system ATP-binding protein
MPHHIVGLIGPNGSGKTTLLECLVGLQPRDGGTVTTVSSQPVKDVAFYVPDDVTPFADLYTSEVLAHFGALFRVARERRAALADRLGLTPVLTTRVQALSKGNRRRLLLALGFLAPRPVLLLDEPFNGLDLYQTRTMMDLLRELQASGRTLVLSIHQLVDAERICDRFLLLAGGRLVGQGSLAELRERTGLPDGSLEDVFLALTPTASLACA